MRYKLKDIFELQMGKTPSRNNPEYWNAEDYKWISIADLTKTGKYISETKEYLSESAVAESGIKVIPANTVVMSFKLSIGKTAITAENMYSNEAIMAFHDKHVVDILPEYIFYMFKFKNWDEGSNKAVMGKTLNKATLSEIRIDICSIEEQRAIVTVLDKMMNLLESREKELLLLDDLIKARFVEMFGTLDNPSQEFAKATLKELCNKITDGKHGGCKAEEGTERYFVGAREIYDDEVHYDIAPEINIDEFEKDYKRCNIEIGDFLIVNTGATIGKSAIATDERTEHTLLQKSVALLKVKKEVLNPVFLKWCYRVNTQMYIIESASAQPNLLLSKINATVIYVPNIELQNQFVSFVEQVDKSKFDGMVWQRWFFSGGMKPADRNNPCGAKEQDKDETGRRK